jgi:hypothetical protein
MGYAFRKLALFCFLLAWSGDLSKACVIADQVFYVLPDFSVEVHDWKGRPAAEVAVVLSPERDWKLQVQTLTVVTDTKGIAAFRNVPLANFGVSVGGEIAYYPRLEVVDPLARAPVVHTVPLRWPISEVVSSRTLSGRLEGRFKPYRLALFDAASGKLLQGPITSETGVFDFDEVNPGLYFLRVSVPLPREQQGDVAVEISQGSANRSLQLSVAFSDCGISYRPIGTSPPKGSP